MEVGAAPVSAEFEQAPDTALELFGGLSLPPDTTARDSVPLITGEADVTSPEVKVVVGQPIAPPAPTPAERPVSRPGTPRIRVKLSGRAIVEKKR